MCVCVLPFWFLSVAVCVLSFLLSSPSLSFYAPLCWILFSRAVEILTLCSQKPHPVTILSSLSSTSPLSWKPPSPSAHTNAQPWIRLQGPACMTAQLTADRLFGLLSVIVASVYFPPLLSPPVLSSLLLSSCHTVSS